MCVPALHTIQEGVCVWGGVVCGGVRWFLASIGDVFRFLPSKLGTHRHQMGISPISSKGCIQYNWGYRVC